MQKTEGINTHTTTNIFISIASTYIRSYNGTINGVKVFEGEAQDEKKNNCNDYDSDKPIATVLMVFTVCMIPADTATAYSSTDME